MKNNFLCVRKYSVLNNVSFLFILFSLFLFPQKCEFYRDPVLGYHQAQNWCTDESRWFFCRSKDRLMGNDLVLDLYGWHSLQKWIWNHRLCFFMLDRLLCIGHVFYRYAWSKSYRRKLSWRSYHTLRNQINSIHRIQKIKKIILKIELADQKPWSRLLLKLIGAAHIYSMMIHHHDGWE